MTSPPVGAVHLVARPTVARATVSLEMKPGMLTAEGMPGPFIRSNRNLQQDVSSCCVSILVIVVAIRRAQGFVFNLYTRSSRYSSGIRDTSPYIILLGYPPCPHIPTVARATRYEILRFSLIKTLAIDHYATLPAWSG